MRGIGKGQTIHLMIIPELERTIRRELWKSDKIERPQYPPRPTDLTQHQEMLRNVAAWLVINSMRSERVQFHQLCLQNVSNTWRKESFRCLMKKWMEFFGSTAASTAKMTDSYNRQDPAQALQVFREPVDFTIASCVPFQ